MDPRAYMSPIEYVGINPRLDTLEGKKIGVLNMGGGNQEAMEPIGPAIMAAYPGTEAEYIFKFDTKDAAFWEFAETCDAIILGINY